MNSSSNEQARPTPSRLFTEYYGSLCLGLMLLFGAGVGLVLKPKFDVLRQVNAEIGNQAQIFEGEQRYLTSLETSIAAAESIAPGVLADVDQALPREARIPELLVLLDRASQQNQVRMLNVSFAETASGQAATRATTSTMSELGVTLTVQAPDYLKLKRFLRDLERSLRLIDVTGIHVAIGGAETSYALQLKAYTYSPPPRSIPTVPQRTP